MNIDELKFDAQGLIPAVIQDFYTKEILTLAYMNRESLEMSLNDHLVTLFSRSRQELWRKGETSGNFQHIVKIIADCDQDALNVQVIKDGPACHTGKESCFFDTLYEDPAVNEPFSLAQLEELIASRKKKPVEGSYTSYLFEKGQEKILKKVGEESTEVVIAAMKNDKKETIYEISDLTYHVLVLMIEAGIPLEAVASELERRHVVDHKKKQEPFG